MQVSGGGGPPGKARGVGECRSKGKASTPVPTDAQIGGRHKPRERDSFGSSGLQAQPVRETELHRRGCSRGGENAEVVGDLAKEGMAGRADCAGRCTGMNMKYVTGKSEAGFRNGFDMSWFINHFHVDTVNLMAL